MPEDAVQQVQSWLDRLNSGDATAEPLLLTFIIDRWRALARRALHGTHKRLEPFEETEGLLSELTVRILQDWRNGSVPTTAGEFFCQTGNNFKHLLVDLCRKFYGRNFQRKPAVSLSPGDSEGASPGHDPGTETYDPAQLALWNEFHAQVDALGENLREVFLLRWYHELNTEKTAHALGISPSLVSKRWIEARLELGKSLPKLALDVQAE